MPPRPFDAEENPDSLAKLRGLRGRISSATLPHHMSAKLKHRWSVGNNYLAGITAGDWWTLLKENRFEIDPPYWHRAAFVTLVSAMNSIYRRKEARLYHEKIAGTEVKPPVFILGHWRSGTTHLHNLLSKDSRFGFANTYQVTNPHTFLCTEETNAKRFAWMVPETRPMDAMELSFQAPQEDEFAPCLMSLRSLYLGVSFPRAEDDYARFLTFEDATREDTWRWMDSFQWFLKKLTLKTGKPLVLKSPPHTARIRLLLEMFPDAKFIHIHRHPYQVFQSCRHYYDTATWYSYLQRPDLEAIDRRIIERYSVMHDAFFSQRDLIPAGNFHETSFDALEDAPVETVRGIYEALGLPDFSVVEPELRRYTASLENYRKNKFHELEPAMREIIASRWKHSFDEWQYPV